MSHGPTIDPKFLAAVRGSVVLAALCSGGLALAQASAPRELPTLAPMLETITPAIVNIAVRTNVEGGAPSAQDELLRRFFDFEGPPGGRGDREVEGAGSGVIVDARNGYILTNHHVVANADKITVTLLENRSLVAHVVGSDEASDIAVLKVEADSLTSIPFGDSTSLRVGDYVVAIGNPFGFTNSVTSGIVSALGRSGLNTGPFEDFIQTDASINPGSSGGNVGIGFAIPVNMARAIMDQLIATGAVHRGLLGVKIQDVTPDIAATLELPSNSGALVYEINPDSAAVKAGIKVEDVIISINGTRLRDSGSLRNSVGLLPPGEKIAVGLIRDGKEQTLTAVLGELTPTAVVSAAPREEEKEEADLDVIFRGAEIVDNSSPSGGLLVNRVDPNSPAADRGLRPGDVITKVNRVPIRKLADAVPIMEDARAILLEVQRNGRASLILMR